MQLKPATETVRKFVVGALFTKTPLGSWSPEPSVQSKETLKVTEFSKQPRDVHMEPTPVQWSDFFINLTWICPALWELTRPLALDLHSQTVPSCLSSGGFSCLLIALFSYFPPKSFLLFFFLFTFKPSQALLSL